MPEDLTGLDYLTEDEINALNGEVQDDAEVEESSTENEDGDTGDSPTPPEDSTSEAEAEDGEGEAPKPVIRAKDGVHEIPYETLEKERNRVKELEEELSKVKGEKVDVSQPEEDRYSDFRDMSRAELYEFKQVAVGDDLERALEYEEILYEERQNQKKETQIAKNKMKEFVDKYDIYEGTDLYEHLQDRFEKIQSVKGIRGVKAIEKLEEEGLSLGLLKRVDEGTSGNDSEGRDEIAKRLKSIESNSNAPRTLADTGTTAKSASKRFDDLPVEEAEAIMANMSPEELSKFLRGV